MTPIQIQIQIPAGPGRSRREVFSDPTVAFGREEGNRIIVTEPAASRRHGELRFDAGQWWLVNLSPNGTEVNGRRVTRKPQPLGGGEVVTVGGREIFRVVFAPPEATVSAPGATPPAPDLPASAAPASASPPGAPSRRRTLWIGIGVYLVVMLGLLLFFSTINARPEQRVVLAPELTAAQIEADVSRPAKVPAPDPRQYQEQLAKASELYDRLDHSPSNLYLAYDAYRQALAYSGRELFEPGMDERRFRDLQDRLVAAVTAQYRAAYGELRTGQYRDASDTFRRLNEDLFPDPESEVHKNAVRQRKVAAEAMKRKR